MNILLIGNGFDLAHGLPTKYDDFLDFVSVFIDLINLTDADIQLYINSDKFKKLNPYIISALIHEFSHKSELQDLESLILGYNLFFNNLWFDYFFENRNGMKDNWIDFESEIAFVVTELDKYINDYSKNYSERITGFFYNYHCVTNNIMRNFSVFRNTYQKKGIKVSIDEFNIDGFINELERDLEKLTFALELYINNYVNRIEVKDLPFEIDDKEVSKVLSFNYSNTYERFYNNNVNSTKVDYIHGKAENHKGYEDNRLVLGINEYLPENERNSNIRFIRFKKYFQRIHKNTGCKYVDWLKENLDPKNNLVIIGHSLDETDGDILKDLIDNDEITTTIFYHNRDAYARQIANLVKVLGQDKVIKKTGGTSPQIQFFDQTKENYDLSFICPNVRFKP